MRITTSALALAALLVVPTPVVQAIGPGHNISHVSGHSGGHVGGLGGGHVGGLRGGQGGGRRLGAGKLTRTIGGRSAT